MKANCKFLNQSKEFWANVRTISQEVGYTKRISRNAPLTAEGEKQASYVLVPTIDDIRKAFVKLNLNIKHIQSGGGDLTEFGKDLISYFEYRANVLNDFVSCKLMDKDKAEMTFNRVKSYYGTQEPNCPLPMNKQKGNKRNYSFLTGIVNMLLDQNLDSLPCNYDPRSLTTVTHNRMPFRTMSRRVDGAFPAVVDPIAIWEIKEYYYTTTFGSRVADGVYESLLDGFEILEMQEESSYYINHTLIVDDYYTWWVCGKSYLCRIIDMLNMGYLDEVLFGEEVLERLPQLASEWKKQYYEKKPKI